MAALRTPFLGWVAPLCSSKGTVRKLYYETLNRILGQICLATMPSQPASWRFFFFFFFLEILNVLWSTEGSTMSYSTETPYMIFKPSISQTYLPKEPFPTPWETLVLETVLPSRFLSLRSCICTGGETGPGPDPAHSGSQAWLI